MLDLSRSENAESAQLSSLEKRTLGNEFEVGKPDSRIGMSEAMTKRGNRLFREERPFAIRGVPGLSAYQSAMRKS